MCRFHPRNSLGFYMKTLRTVIVIVVHDLNMLSSSFPSLTPIQSLLPSYRVFTCSPSQPGVHYVSQACFKLTAPSCHHLFISYSLTDEIKHLRKATWGRAGWFACTAHGHDFHGKKVVVAGGPRGSWSHSISGSSEWWIVVLSSPSPFYSV